MICIVYVSCAAQKFTGEELHRLLYESRKRNAHRGITGLLLYADGNVMQALEGPEAAVDELLKSLAADKRHMNLTVILREPIEHRLFPGWSMSLLDPSVVPPRDMEIVSGFLRHVDPIIPPSNIVMKLLHSFRHTMNRA